MRTPHTILVVEADLHVLFSLLDTLRDEGFECTGAATYEAGRELLSNKSFDLLVANARIGPHNGLNLIRQCRLLFPGMEAIVLTSVYDQEARDEARRYGAPWLDVPVDGRRLVARVTRALSSLVNRRRWVRKRAQTEPSVLVGQSPASLLDVCYGGLRFEMSEPDGTLPPVVPLRVPALGQPLLVELVWMDRARESKTLRCGAAVVSTDGPVFRAWRDMVDGLPPLASA
jgi:CheY-like chemotaxis protein